jgi:hypothetical protein
MPVQQCRRGGPWCAHFNTGLNACTFYSFREWQVAVAGVGGYCAQNGFERPTWSRYDAAGAIAGVISLQAPRLISNFKQIEPAGTPVC